jgi:hypothetical protein
MHALSPGAFTSRAAASVAYRRITGAEMISSAVLRAALEEAETVK